MDVAATEKVNLSSKSQLAPKLCQNADNNTRLAGTSTLSATLVFHSATCMADAACHIVQAQKGCWLGSLAS